MVSTVGIAPNLPAELDGSIGGKKMSAADGAEAPERGQLEALLSGVLDAPVHISRSDRLMPWFLVRCHLPDPRPPHMPESVIVKWLRDDPRGSVAIRNSCAPREPHSNS